MNEAIAGEEIVVRALAVREMTLNQNGELIASFNGFLARVGEEPKEARRPVQCLDGTLWVETGLSVSRLSLEPCATTLARPELNQKDAMGEMETARIRAIHWSPADPEPALDVEPRPLQNWEAHAEIEPMPAKNWARPAQKDLPKLEKYSPEHDKALFVAQSLAAIAEVGCTKLPLEELIAKLRRRLDNQAKAIG